MSEKKKLKDPQDNRALGLWMALPESIRQLIGNRLLGIVGTLLDGVWLGVWWIVTDAVTYVTSSFEVSDRLDEVTLLVFRILLSASLLIPVISYLYTDIRKLLDFPSGDDRHS